MFLNSYALFAKLISGRAWIGRVPSPKSKCNYNIAYEHHPNHNNINFVSGSCHWSNGEIYRLPRGEKLYVFCKLFHKYMHDFDGLCSVVVFIENYRGFMRYVDCYFLRFLFLVCGNRILAPFPWTSRQPQRNTTIWEAYSQFHRCTVFINIFQVHRLPGLSYA